MPLPTSADLTRSVVIGIDGGGTKTEAALAHVDPNGQPSIVARCTAGPGNLQAPSWDVVTDNVSRAVFGVLGDAEVRPPAVAAIAFCMAGAGHEVRRRRFEDWARSQKFVVASRLLVTHDARALIEAGTPQGQGVALIAGTGSLAYARTPRGEEARAGGWGSLLGDEGSAYWLVLEALRASCRAVDQRGPETQLTAALAEWLNCTDPRQWPAKLRTLEPGDIAAAAPLVSQAAAQHDAAAAELLARCADRLAALIIHLARRCFASEAVDVALAGGLILQNAALRQAVLDGVANAGVVVRQCREVRNPVDGAVRLAARMLLSGRGGSAGDVVADRSS